MAPVGSLNQAIAYELPAHSSTGMRSERWLLPLLGSLRFHILFYSPMGVLFTLLSWYYFAIGHPGVFNLARWSLLIHTGFHMPHATRKQFERLPYSGISGSMLIFNSLKHFVDYYALPRLWVPRYPPSNRRIRKIGCYHKALYRLSSRVGDKRTRTADIRHRESGPCLSPSVADHPLGPATDHRLGKIFPHQLANQTRAPLRADSSFCSSAYGVLAAISSYCSPPKDRFLRVTHPSATGNTISRVSHPTCMC
ncbi:Glutamine synthetase I [Capsicum annuum]|nr:Glutamine synthetase I [Capsicum annuum]